MTKIELIEKLTLLPGLIETAENEVIKAVDILQGQKDRLIEAQDRLLVLGAIDGKNQETRNAQLRAQTTAEQFTVRKAENDLSVAKAKLNRLVNELAVCRAIAGMIRGCE